MNSKNLSRRDFLKASLTVGSAAALAACVPVDQAGDTGGGASAPAEEKVTLTFGRHWEAAFRPRQDEWDALFVEKHPEFEIEITYNTWSDHNSVVPTWAAANTLPDVVYVHGSRSFPWSHEGILISIQGYIDEDVEFNVAGIWEESLRLYRYRGQQYCIPYDHGPIILGYNKEIFDEFDHAYPDGSWTMDDLREAAIAMTDVDNQKWGWTGSYPSLGNTGYGPCLGGWGVDVYNEDETEFSIDSPEAIAALQFWVDLIHVDKVAPTPAESAAFEQGPWISGKIAMSQVASWNTPTWHKFAPFEWDVAPLPSGPARRFTGSFGSGYGITRDSKNPDEAWEYLSEYLSVEGMEFMWGSTGRGSPAREEAYDVWMESEPAPEHAEYFLDALDNYATTGSPYQTLAAAEIGDVTGRETALLRSGEKPVEEVVEVLMETVNNLLTEGAERLNA